MTLVRWNDPFREFAQLQERINRAFSDAYGRSGSADEGFLTSGSWVPPVDIYQNGEHELVLKAELPDMTREDIDITVDNGTLTIKGEKKLSNEVKEEQFHRIERRYGTFSRSFSLPQTVDPGKVAAEYRNGVLSVRLPLREEAKPRQIKVDVAA
jgi:HSP20 family protein